MNEKRKPNIRLSRNVLITTFIIGFLILPVIGSMEIVRFAVAKPSSDKGWIVYSKGSDAVEGLHIMDMNGKNQKQLTNTRDSESAWSPDGRQIAFARMPRGDLESRGIYVMNANGANVTRLTDYPYDNYPSWSPDGQSIAFSRSIREEKDENNDGMIGIELISLYVMNSDGTFLRKLTEENPKYWDDSPDWSPDGKKIAFTRGIEVQMQVGVGIDNQIWIMDANGENQEMLYKSGMNPAWSPDGTKIAFWDTYFR